VLMAATSLHFPLDCRIEGSSGRSRHPALAKCAFGGSLTFLINLNARARFVLIFRPPSSAYAQAELDLN
jgi:hypothetical protein